MTETVITWLVFLLTFGGMVLLHEFGHFVVARLNNIEVEEFGIGLPTPGAITLFHWRGTRFTLNWLPFGGFVRPKGENDPAIPGGLAAANPWRRLAVLFAGPLMNLLTAVIVFAIVVSLSGVAVPGPIVVRNVSPSSPAQAAGLQPDDRIVAMNGQDLTSVQSAIDIIRANLDKPVTLLIERDAQQITLEATPLSSRSAEQGALGVELSSPRRPATPAESIGGGFAITGLQAVSILYLPVALVQGLIQPGEARLVGLKGIFDMFGAAVQQDVQTRQPAGASAAPPSHWTLNLIGLLSVSLGVMNLLPIPALDGGRILFTLPELLFRRRIPVKYENMINSVAMLLLIALMLFINAMDFLNPIKPPIP